MGSLNPYCFGIWYLIVVICKIDVDDKAAS